mgnify:CR=1 FL=1
MEIDFNKYENKLVPAIVQDAMTKNVLMLGFMNQEAVDKTESTGKVTFFSRRNYLNLVSLKTDCDNDTLLIQAHPEGPACHTGSDTCWNEKNQSNFGFLSYLENVIEDRRNDGEHEKSYVASLFKRHQ